MMHGRPACERTDSDSLASGVTEDYDVVIAKRAYGAGSLMLFCDINMEADTVLRVLGYAKKCSPSDPIDSVARLDADECEKASNLRAMGTAAFGEENFDVACSSYEGALDVYGERGGAAGEQRYAVIGDFYQIVRSLCFCRHVCLRRACSAVTTR